MPAIPFDELSLWDGTSAWTKGTHGDVQEEAPEVGESRAAEVGVFTLAYLRPGAAGVAALPAKTEGAAGRFELDTGNGGGATVPHAPGAAALLSPKAASRSARGIRFGSGGAAAYSTHEDITVGADTEVLGWKDAPISVLDPADPHAGSVEGDGNLGFDFLRHTKNTLGCCRRTLFVLQRTPFWPRAHYGFIGATLDRDGGKLVVVDVIPGSPADVAGLHVKDEIIDVNGVKPGGASLSRATS